MTASGTPEENGEPATLGALIDRHLPALRAYVRLNVPADVRARESCSDLVQSVCRELVAQRQEFDYRGPEAFRAWLFQAALHKIQDHAKYHRADKRAPRHEVAADAPGEIAALYASLGTPSAHAIANECATLVERAFDELAPEDRQVIALCRIAGLSRDEVARAMGKTLGALRTHLSRALARLAGELDRLGVSF